jgi:DNA-binding NarL/FixJ family response regulator
LTTVLVVDDHRVVAEALASYLGTDPELSVVGIAGGVDEAVERCAELRPDVVLLDWRLAGGTGADAAVRMRAARPELVILFLSAEDSDDAVLAAVEVGASGFLLKTLDGDHLVSAVKAAAAGEMLLPPARLAALLAGRRRQAREEADHRRLLGELTSRELEILQLMARGEDNRAIAKQLFISYQTVRTHVRRILDKLSARTKLEAVVKALDAGLQEH